MHLYINPKDPCPNYYYKRNLLFIIVPTPIEATESLDILAALGLLFFIIVFNRILKVTINN